MHFHKLSKHQDVKLISLKHDGKEYVTKIFDEFLNQNNIERYSRYTSRGAEFAERFIRTIRNLLKNANVSKRKR